jgi:hypothetical protein
MPAQRASAVEAQSAAATAQLVRVAESVSAAGVGRGLSVGFDSGADVGRLATFSTPVGLAVATVVGLAFAAGVRLAIAAAVGVAVVPTVGIVTAVRTCVPTCGSSAPVTVAAAAAVRLPWRSVAWIINVPSETESGTVTRTPPNCPFWSAGRG